MIGTATVFLSFFSFFLPPSLQEGIFNYISLSHWSWPSICWSYRSLLECLSYPPPFSTCYKLWQTMWYDLGVISSLMRPDCQLRAFNAEVTTSLRIAHPPCPHSCPLCWSFCLGRLGGLSLRVCYFPLQWPWLAEDKIVLGDAFQQLGPSLLILWCFFFLGVGLELDMKWAGLCQILQPHNSPSKSCCPAPRTKRKVLISSEPFSDLLSLVLC